ncbi:MAG: DUF488 family protein [Syntrophaceae bacterium]
MKINIQVKRAYNKPHPDDGSRILVDRLWPRGLTRNGLKIDDWVKEIAPSNDLRKWYGHDHKRWEEFKKRYFQELEDRAELTEQLMKTYGKSRLTLLYAAKDESFNNATALKEYLERKAESNPSR